MKKHFVACALLLCGIQAWASAQAVGNPDDPGNAGYARHWYVDSRSSCNSSRCGSQQYPFKRLQDAVARLQAGDELIIAGHDDAPYNDWINLPRLDRSSSDNKPTLIRAWKGLPQPVIRGSQPYSGWRATKYPNTYALSWDYTPPDDPGTVLEPQQVFRGNVSLQQVGGTVFGGYPNHKHPDLTHEEIWPGRIAERSPSELQPNQFMYDRRDEALYVRLASPLKTDPDSGAVSETLDVSIRHFLLVNNVSYKVNNLTVQDIVFERASTSYYWRAGAIMLNGNNITLDHVVVQDMDSFCIQLSGNNNTVRHSIIQRCGQLGLAASGKNLTVQGNQFLDNNTRRFNPFWEAGAMKFVSTTPISGARIIDNTVANTILGDGIWLDTYQNDNLIANNRVAYNNGIGIHIEVSNKAHIDGNIIVGNAAQGIQMVDSSESTVSGNVIAGNVQDGVLIQSDGRTNGNPGYRPVNNTIAKNTFAWNWEISRDKNYRSVAVPSSNRLSSNYYCGTGVGTPLSMHFVLDNVVHDWLSWNKSGIETKASHQMGKLPNELRDRIMSRDLTLVGSTAPVLNYIKANCKGG